MIERFETGNRMSQAVRAGNLVFLAGQVADQPTASVEDQTRQILARIDHLLVGAGLTKANLVSVTIWLVDISRFAEMNTVWDEWIADVAAPARATVEARLAALEYLVEISAIAADGP